MKKEIESGFFDSVDGDRKYTAEEMTEYYGHLYGSGIAYGKGNNLALITSASENRATLCDGVAYVEGRWYNQTIGIQYVIGVTDIYYSIALKCDKNERIISSVIIPGTADAPPDITSENNISYMKLYDIVSENNIVRIVKDYRGSAECPYIKPLSEKVDKEEGKGLSHNDFTDFYKKAVEAIPEELQQKADLSHTHSKSDITDFPEKLPASDVYPWAKDPQKPSYSWGEISGKPSVFPPESHSHAWSSITGKPGTFPPSYHSHGISDIDNLSGALDEKLSIASRNYVPVRYVSESMNFDTDFQLASTDPNKVIFTNTKSVTNSNSPTGIPMPYMLTVERLYVNGVSNYFRQTFTGLMNAGSESAYIVEYQRLYIYTASPFWTEWKAVASGGEDDHKVIQEYVGGADYEYPMLCSTDTEHTQSATTDKVLKLLGMTINPKTGTITAPKFKGILEGRASSADSVEWGNVSDKPESYPPETHSHNYAASTYAGGAALSANKLNTDAGSATVPVYFSGGVPAECTYGLNKTVPADAVFTDGCIDQRNSSGNFSLPLLLGFNNDTDVNGFAWKNSKFTANPSTGEMTATTFNGSIAWGNVTGKPSSFTPSSHSHSMSDISNLNTTINSLSSILNSINTALTLHKVSKPLTKSSGQPDLIVRAESYVQYNDYLWKFYLYFTNAKNISANTETVIATTSYPPKYTVVKTGVSIWKNDNSAAHTNNATVRIKSNGDITITTPTTISGTGVNYARINGEIFTAVNF